MGFKFKFCLQIKMRPKMDTRSFQEKPKKIFQKKKKCLPVLIAEMYAQGSVEVVAKFSRNIFNKKIKSHLLIFLPLHPDVVFQMKQNEIVLYICLKYIK